MYTKRCFDFLFSLTLIVILCLPIIFIFILIRLSSPGPAIFWSKRIGKNNREFMMPKFRSMQVDTPTVATHLLDSPADWLTPVGSFLRKTSVDEIPQLWSILKGDMSFVGPRPALFTQHDLIELRTLNGVQQLVPGLTGWAQVNGRDELSISKKVELDVEYLNRMNMTFDIYIIFKTLRGVFYRQGISH